jgi:hypothetical protein
VSRRGLSRIQFITAGSAALAACSGGGQSAFMPGTPKGNTLSTASTSTATSASGVVISSSADNRAIAFHSPTGEFFASVAFGKKYVRFTNPTGSVALPKRLPAHAGWFRLPNGGRFKAKTFKSGRHGILAVDPAGRRTLYHIGPGGTIYVRDSRGHVAKMPMAFDLSVAPSSKTVPDPVGLAALKPLVHKPGAWTGDDDFASKESSYSGNADLKMPHHRKKSSSTRRVKELEAGDGFADGGAGDGGFASIGDGGGGGGGGSSGGDGGGADFGGSDLGDGNNGDTITCSAGDSSLTDDLGVSCFWDGVVLGGAILALISAGIFGLTICIVGGVFTLGASCVAAILAVLATSAAAAYAWHVYVSDNCPLPPLSYPLPPC